VGARGTTIQITPVSPIATTTTTNLQIETITWVFVFAGTCQNMHQSWYFTKYRAYAGKYEVNPALIGQIHRGWFGLVRKEYQDRPLLLS